MWGKLVAAARRYWTYTDVILAFAGGVVVSVLGLLDVLGDRALTQATVGVVSILALSLLQDRVVRHRQFRTAGSQLKRVRTGLAKRIKGLSEDVNAISGEATHVVKISSATWDLQTQDRAVATRVKEIRFHQNNVFAVLDRAKADGEEIGLKIEAKRLAGVFIELQTTRQPILDDAARPVRIVALDRMYRRGEETTIRTRRILKDSFPNDQEEYVTLLLDHPTERVELSVIWPAAKPPTEIWATRSTGDIVTARVDVPLGMLVDEGGRKQLKDFRITSPNRGEMLKVTWRW